MQSGKTAPSWARDVVDRCLRDMQQPTVIDVDLQWLADRACTLQDPNSGGDGISFSYLGAGNEVVVAFADFLQEHVFPESDGAWGEARPACRGHRHPAKPTVLDGAACWICPDTGQRLALIGAYKHPIDRRSRRKARRR